MASERVSSCPTHLPLAAGKLKLAPPTRRGSAASLLGSLTALGQPEQSAKGSDNHHKDWQSGLSLKLKLPRSVRTGKGLLLCGCWQACRQPADEVWSPLLLSRPGQDSLVTPLLHPGVDCSGRHELQSKLEWVLLFFFHVFIRSSRNDAAPEGLKCYKCRRSEVHRLQKLACDSWEREACDLDNA